MISMPTYPPLVSLAKNPIVYKFTTDNAIETAGVKADAWMIFVTQLAVGDSFDFIFGSTTITFTATNTPDKSGTQIKAIAVGQNLSNWVQQTWNYIKANNYIDANFDISEYSSNGIHFIAKNYGSDFSISIANEPAAKMGLGGNVAGVAEIYRSLFGIILKTLVKETTVFLEKMVDVLSVNSNQQAIVDISEIIKPSLLSEFQFPEASSNGFVKRSKMLLPFQLKYAEQFGIPTVAQGLTTSGTFYALNGGIPFWKQAEFYQGNTSFWDRMQYEKNFLTWAPKTKYIDENQIEKLYFLLSENPYANLSISITITLHYRNGTSSYRTLTQTAASFLDVYELQIGYAKLSYYFTMPVVGSAITVDSYDVQITSSTGTIISEKRTYIVDRKTYPNTRYFIFKNSLGAYDTLRTTGIAETEQTLERETVNIQYPKEFNVAFRQKKQINIIGGIKQKVNTGWLPNKETADWLQDFFLSDEVFEIKENNLYPINITSTSGVQYTDEQTPAYFCEFEYERSNDDGLFVSANAISTLLDLHFSDFSPIDFDS